MVPEFFRTTRLEKELSSFGLGNIINSSFLTRLKGVSFLSTMDTIYGVEFPFSRYDHSIGVAYLALELCKSLGLSILQTKILVISSLLHDIGHSPFSHAAETFLLETKKKYHEGMLNTYLRYNKRLFSNAPGLKEILSIFPEKISESVISLLLNRKTGDSIIDELHFTSINCDKLDGTNRTLFSLGREYYNPLSFVKAFSLESNRLYADPNYLSQFSDFWAQKTRVYNDYIYVLDVLSAEAMLTRSLELAFSDRKDVQEFLASTDEIASKAMLNKTPANKVFGRLIEKHFFVPLSSYDFSLFEKYRKKILASRFNKKQRLHYEEKIAENLNLDPTNVVSHFSFRKEFYFEPHHLNQKYLFEINPEMVPLSVFKKAFYTKRLSGDVFNIFIG